MGPMERAAPVSWKAMVSVTAAVPLSCRVEFLPICRVPLPVMVPFCVRVHFESFSQRANLCRRITLEAA